MSLKKTISLLPFIIIAACSNPKHDDEVAVSDTVPHSPIIEEAIQQAQPPSTANIEVKTFPNTGDLAGSYGYDVLLDGKIYIHQPNIPAVSGNKGFTSEEQAKKVGEFMAGKIRNNIMPPSVSTEELDSLGVK